VGAFSTSHSMVSALPAMSANSAPGTRERISVAAVLGVCVSDRANIRKRLVKLATRTSKDDAKVACGHQVLLVVLLDPAGGKPQRQ